MFDTIYNGLVNLINRVVDNLSLYLPGDPFASFINELSDIPWIGVLNYFVPIGIFLDILLAWVTALGVFYVYSIILRWVKVVGE